MGGAAAASAGRSASDPLYSLVAVGLHSPIRSPEAYYYDRYCMAEISPCLVVFPPVYLSCTSWLHELGRTTAGRASWLHPAIQHPPRQPLRLSEKHPATTNGFGSRDAAPVRLRAWCYEHGMALGAHIDHQANSFPKCPARAKGLIRAPIRSYVFHF